MASNRWLFCALAAGLVLGCGGGVVPDDSAKNLCARVDLAASSSWPGLCLSPVAQGLIHQELRLRVRSASIMTPTGGFDPRFYPAEVFVSVASIADDFQDEELKSWLQDQLSLLERQLALTSGYLIWPVQIDAQPAFGSNSQSRLVIGLTLLQTMAPSERWRSLARQAFDALDRMPRLTVRSSVTGRNFQLPAYAYLNPAAPTIASSRAMDPNQDAALALAYALAARHLASDAADSLAIAQKGQALLDAAMDLASASGCLPLVDDPSFLDVCDSRYNGFWLALTHKAGQLLNHGSAIRPAIAAQHGILKAWWTQGQTSRHYPARYEGPFPDPIEPIVALAAVASLGSDEDWAQHLAALERTLQTAPPQTWPAGWIYPHTFMRLQP